MPQSEISDDLKRQLAARYLRHALGEAPTVPWYVAAQLCPALFDLKEDDTLPIDRVTKELEETLAHKSEVGTPLFLYLDGHTSGTTVECIELSSLLAFRSTAFARFFAPTMHRSVVHYSSSVAVHSLAEAYVTAAESQTLAAVIHAAAELDDALLEDWGWQIATLAQAIKAGLEQIVQRQIPRVLGIEAADPGILAFLEDKFDRAIRTLSEENTSHVLDARTAQARIRELGPMVGHLPWRSNVGFGSVYDCFTPTPDEQSATWAEAEKWLSEDRPAWWFHVWLTAVNHPRAIPRSAWPTVWLKLGILLGGTIDGFEGERRNAALYATLLQFYSYRLESSLPTARSDFIFWCASRLASDVVSALSQADADIDVLLSQALHDAKIAWHVASPSFAATSLRSAFLSFHSYWPSAVQSSVSDWFTSEAKEHIPEGIRQVLVDLVRHMCLRATMLPHDESGTTSSLVIGNLSYVNEEWKEVVGQDEISHLMSDHRRLVDVFSTPDSIVRKFLEPILENDIEGLVAFFRWCNYVRSGYISMDQAIDLLTSDVWIDKVEPSLKPELLDSVVAALLGGLWTGRETLRVEVSHWSARRCLAYLSDNERRSLYCAATVLFSLKGYTASAITRLVYEDIAERPRA